MAESVWKNDATPDHTSDIDGISAVNLSLDRDLQAQVISESFKYISHFMDLAIKGYDKSDKIGSGNLSMGLIALNIPIAASSVGMLTTARALRTLINNSIVDLTTNDLAEAAAYILSYTYLGLSDKDSEELKLLALHSEITTAIKGVLPFEEFKIR